MVCLGGTTVAGVDAHFVDACRQLARNQPAADPMPPDRGRRGRLQLPALVRPGVRPRWEDTADMTADQAGRWSRTSRVIRAHPEDVYGAFLDPVALVEWLPPAKMTGEIHAFDARVGGGYWMSLFHPPEERSFRGKTADREDRVDVRFVALAPPRRIVEAVNFVTTDPAFFGEMTLTASFEAVPGGTAVTLLFEHLPPGCGRRTTTQARDQVWSSWPAGSNRNCPGRAEGVRSGACVARFR